MSTKLTFPRGGTAIAPGASPETLLPRGYTVTPPGSAGELLLPGGQSGLDSVADTIPTPTLYYSLDDLAGGLVDEMGSVDLDSTDHLSSATGKKSDGITDDDNGTYSGVANGTSDDATPHKLRNLLVTLWAKKPTSGADYLTVEGHGPSGGGYGTQFIQRIESYLDADDAWHHVLLSFVAPDDFTDPDIYISVDAADRVLCTSGSTVDNNVWGPNPRIDLYDMTADELGFIMLDAEPSAAAVKQYAAAIYNSGTGRFYRSATGWAAP